MQDFRSILVYASIEDEAFLAIDHAASPARESGAEPTVVRILEERGAGRATGSAISMGSMYQLLFV